MLLRPFSRSTYLLQYVFILIAFYLFPICENGQEGGRSNLEAPSSCIDDSSTLLRSIIRYITTYNELLELKVSELLVVWSDLIANWHAWEEMEDLSIFECIKEVVNLHGKFGLKDFIMRGLPSPPAPPVPQRSIIEGISVFVSAAIKEYPSATWRASSCVHVLLHVPSYSPEVECVKQSLVIAFTEAAFSRFKAIRHKPCSMWKPLLLTISSCYLCYPDIVERVLVKNEHAGFTIWASALGFVATSAFEHHPSAESEIKLTSEYLSYRVSQNLQKYLDLYLLVNSCCLSY